MSNFISISNEMSHFDYPSLSQDFEWKPHLEMALIYQVLTKQCLKKVFPTSNDFVPSGSSLLNGPNFGPNFGVVTCEQALNLPSSGR